MIILSLAALLGAVACLIILCIIDFKHRLLPNVWVAAFLGCGLVFHIATAFAFVSPLEIFIGAVIGGVPLYIIRFFANRYYKADTLGLGDVKLMGAAGVWLGPYLILIAISAGAMAGVVHGLIEASYLCFKMKRWPNMERFSLPAGPGFAVGIVIALVLMLKDSPEIILP
ncbi:MAG: prepilin peptidase [Alphaproteobacteria bacterium]|nr:prepilin peptidase [Alphaproteobacteria bacterium]